MPDAGAWGIDPGYHDVSGTWHAAPDATIAAFLRAMGVDPAGSDDLRPPEASDGNVYVVRHGDPVAVDGEWALTLEDGTVAEGRGQLPADLPMGYHDLVRAADQRRIRLVVGPGRAHWPERLRTWGFAAQLYATRSGDSWGIGDLNDLGRLCRWSSAQGAGMLLLNPLHAPLPAFPQTDSPYYPSSRCFRNPINLRVEDVPGAAALLDGKLDELAAAGRALNGQRIIDRDAVWRLKSAALETVFAAAPPSVSRHDPLLERYATFCAITEAYGVDWRTWPTTLRHPDSPGVAAFAADPNHAARIRYHVWLQELVAEQLAAATAGDVAVMQDLAIGADPAGADGWMWQDTFASGVRVGAPPDEFNRDGQDWGFPPFDPWRLRAAAFEPFVRIVRAGFAHAGALRIDHVMGLFRLFWIPEDGGPQQGTYVRYPWHELLDILALESARAGAYVVGEDLGTVEPWVREALAERRVASYRLLWFEDEPPPQSFPELALGAVSTHDLPTVAGLWTGADLDDQRACGVTVADDAAAGLHAKLERWGGLTPDAPVRDAIDAAHRLVAASPSAIVTPTLDDALGVAERPNLPGTTDERPNWRLALPLPLEAIEKDPGVLETVRIFRGR